jgi:SAM-dependent methyltransferase
MKWLPLQEHYEQCLAIYGPTPRGVDSPDSRHLESQFATQLGILSGVSADKRPSLLDLGCGPGLLLDYLTETDRLRDIEYYGIDISSVMIETARRRWPDFSFDVRDIVNDPLPDRSVDVVIANGVLTERLRIAHDEMVGMAQDLIRSAFRSARVGVAFNVMSRHVDWEREDLFHWSFDEVAAFLKCDVSRHFAIRADYGLYEFTAFVWREPQRAQHLPHPSWWER